MNRMALEWRVQRPAGRLGVARRVPSIRAGHYIVTMGTAIFLLSISALLVLWDFFLKATSVICRPVARSFLNARVSHMAAHLMRLARVYGHLSVELDDRLTIGLPNPCLVCANHQSMADIAVLMAAFKSHSLRFVAKKELTRGFPAVSEVLRIQQHALIDRHGGYRSTVKALATLGQRAKHGLSPVVFAEGTRSRTGEVTRFHTGGVRSILEITPLPIVGVAIDGGYHFASMTNLLKNLRGITYRIGFVGVFDPGTTKRSIGDAVEAVQDSVAQQINEWHSLTAVQG
ncbi:MAG: 1-acyl-sn-glycerol-3-phosphate acyltransferase [Spirochaetales bacterium]|nr:1-acyl-sn-glycerol-3-phosphate acyltransferase [Spirochaetales bacterium]